MLVFMAALEEERAERLPDGLRLLLLREGVLVVEQGVGALAPIAFIHAASRRVAVVGAAFAALACTLASPRFPRGPLGSSRSRKCGVARSKAVFREH